jgi:hypothetical protein
VCLALAPLAELQADVIDMKDGRRIVGRVITRREAEKQLVVELDSGIALLIDEQDIKQRVAQQKAEEQYPQELANTPDTVEGHLALAGWCDKVGLRSQRDAHYERVLDLDPDNRQARAGLEYRLERGRWFKKETIMSEQRGKVRVKGQRPEWQFPEVVALNEERSQARASLDAVSKELRRWHDDVMAGNRRAPESLAKIRELNNPQAVSAIRSILFPSSVQRITKAVPPDALRQVYVDLLGRIETPASAQTLVQISMTDPSPLLVEQCHEHLRRFAQRQATVAYIRYLRSDNTDEIDRAGLGIAAMRDEASVQSLIEGLVTQHRRQAPTGPAINSNFSNDPGQGGGSFSYGDNQPKYIMIPHQSNTVRGALIAITGEDFQFDQAAWLDWYARKYFPSAGDLRRDP